MSGLRVFVTFLRTKSLGVSGGNLNATVPLSSLSRTLNSYSRIFLSAGGRVGKLEFGFQVMIRLLFRLFSSPSSPLLGCVALKTCLVSSLFAAVVPLRGGGGGGDCAELRRLGTCSVEAQVHVVCSLAEELRPPVSPSNFEASVVFAVGVGLGRDSFVLSGM